MHDQAPLLSAAECARQIGLSVRTLRVYEDRGLLSPRRTAKGWRVYGAAELTRLGEILTLKSLGLSLAQISEAFTRDHADLDAILSAQHSQLTEQQRSITAMLARLDALRPRLAQGCSLSVDELITLSKETHAMTAQPDDTAWKRYEQMRPRTAIKMPADMLSDAPGAYHFQAQTYGQITASGRKLYLQLLGQPKVQLFAEGPDKLFAKAAPAQMTLTRDATGAVTGLTLHQNGVDTPALRISDAAFSKAKDALASRRASAQPLPDSETLLRRFLASQIEGAPDMAMLAPALAQAVVDQQEVVQAELDEAGALQEVTFKGVSPEGSDIFTLTFEATQIDCAISLNDDGLISGLYLGPTL